jgi:hypothetical protein
MLSARQRIATALCALGAVILALLLAVFGPRPIPAVGSSPVEARFDGQSAIAYTRALSVDYPDRVTGSAGARRAAQYIRSQFEEFGYKVETMPFALWLRGERVRGENIVATLEGDTPESVSVMAHYDGQTTSHQAAEDNASGVGVLLELARVLRALPHRRGLILIASDAEEWGMIGARALGGFLKAKNTVAVISIDYLNWGSAPALGMDCMGQSAGYTPLWLRELVVEAGKAQNVRVEQPGPAWEFVERAVEVSAQDQGPLVRQGIPAVNLATLTKEYAASRLRYHTVLDVFQNFDPASFKMLGATVEQAMVTLDSLPPVVSGGMTYWRVSARRYLPGDRLRLVLTLLILPSVLAGLFAARNLGAELRPPWSAVLRPLAYAVPPWLAVVVLYALTAANILKRWELYPATPKDPFLYEIPGRVVLPLLLALLAGYVVLRKVRSRLRVAPPAGAQPPSFARDKQALYVWLCCVSVFSFLLNPFAMWLYLGPFACVALLLVRPRGLLKRGFNALLLLLAVVPFLALLYYFGAEIFLGWRIVWYLILQTAYGVWSPFAAILFLLAVVLWLRFVAISVLAGQAGL